MNEIKEKAKELCEKSTCHHKCHDTKDCVVEDEALLLINENKSNNFDVKSNKSQCIDCVHNEICQFYKALGATVICYPCGFYEAKSNEELFKQALVEGVNNRFNKILDEEEKTEEMATVIRQITTKCCNCEYYEEDGSCIKPAFMDCNENEDILIVCDALYEHNYRKQSENTVELPCKVGTTLYFLYNRPYADKPDLTPRIYKTTDWYFEVDKTGIVINTSHIHSFNKEYDYHLGKTVFLTKEEAENALAKMKGGEQE